MKLRLLSSLLVLTIAFSACQNSNKTTEKSKTSNKTTEKTKKTKNSFTASKYGFSINFLAAPETKKKVVESKIGDITITTYNLEKEGFQYFVVASELPKMIMTMMKPADILQQAKKDVIARIKDVKIIAEKEIEIDGHPGLEIEAVGTYKGTMSYSAMRLYIIDNKPIHLLTVSEKSKKDRAKMYKFLDSFELN